MGSDTGLEQQSGAFAESWERAEIEEQQPTMLCGFSTGNINEAKNYQTSKKHPPKETENKQKTLYPRKQMTEQLEKVKPNKTNNFQKTREGI